jgi:hypothetical protein
VECGLPPKRPRGLGIQDLEVKNTALLGKWLFRLITEDRVWQTLLRHKYVGSKALSQVFCKPGDSHFLVGLMATKKYFLAMESFRLRICLRYVSGRISGLVLATTLREKYSALYAIVFHKGDTIAHILECNPPNVTFKRNLYGHRLGFGRPSFNAWLMSN